MKSVKKKTRTREILEALAPVVCPPEIVSDGHVEATVDALEEFLEAAPPMIGNGVAAGLAVFDLCARFHPYFPSARFTELSAESKRRYFGLWWHSSILPIREFAKKTKGLMVLQYYELPEVMDRLDFHPDRWIAKVSKERMEKYGDHIRTEEASVTVPDPLPLGSRARTQSKPTRR